MLAAAAALFYRNGIRAVGVDAIVAESGVAKMSLYRHFASKDDLVVAFLRARDAEYWERWDRIAADRPDDPVAQLRAWLGALATRTSDPAFRGCPFVNTASELAERTHRARGVIAEHKREMLARLTGLCERIGVDDPVAVAQQLALLVEGAYAASQSFGPSGPMGAIVAAADAIIAAHRRPASAVASPTAQALEAPSV